MGIVKGRPNSILCNSSTPDDPFHPEPVDCFADLTLAPSSQPGILIPIAAGHRYIVKNVSGPIDSGWINLPLGLGDGDIIERDFQNLNWLLDVDISEVGEGPIVYVRCKCYEYWYGCNGWEEISPCNFGGYPEYEDFYPTSIGQTVFLLAIAPKQPARTIFTINGIDYVYGEHFTINGSVLTWIVPEIELELCDKIQVRYC